VSHGVFFPCFFSPEEGAFLFLAGLNFPFFRPLVSDLRTRTSFLSLLFLSSVFVCQGRFFGSCPTSVLMVYVVCARVFLSPFPALVPKIDCFVDYPLPAVVFFLFAFPVRFFGYSLTELVPFFFHVRICLSLGEVSSCRVLSPPLLLTSSSDWVFFLR